MPAKTLSFGVTLPQIKRTWAEARAAAQEFEALGYDSVWVCDHLYGVPSPDLPILEAWTELTAVAAITERVKVGSLVTPPGFRNPAVFAKQLATIDSIAPGRVIAGLGAGWFEAEFRGYGADFPSIGGRMDGLEDTCEILTRMWSEGHATYVGKRYSVDDVACEPKPQTRPSILIGGGGEKRLLAIAAKYADIWNNLAVNQGVLAEKVAAFRARCADVGRDPDSVVISQQCTVVIAEDDSGARDALAKASKIYGGHMGAGLEAHGIWGSPDRVVDCIQRHVELGCTMFVIEFFGRDTREPARLFAEKVLPAFGMG